VGNCRALLEAVSSTLICPGTTHTLTRQWPRLRESSWNTSSRATTVGPSLVARPNTVSKDFAQHRRRTWYILFLAEAPDVAQRQPLPVRHSWHRTRTHSDAQEQVLGLIPLAGRFCDDCGHCESSVELGLTPAVQHRLDEVHGLGPPPLTLPPRSHARLQRAAGLARGGVIFAWQSLSLGRHNTNIATSQAISVLQNDSHLVLLDPHSTLVSGECGASGWRRSAALSGTGANLGDKGRIQDAAWAMTCAHFAHAEHRH
jgi:hypothetical protein